MGRRPAWVRDYRLNFWPKFRSSEAKHKELFAIVPSAKSDVTD
jgi:hypothetical protein